MNGYTHKRLKGIEKREQRRKKMREKKKSRLLRNIKEY